MLAHAEEGATAAAAASTERASSRPQIDISEIAAHTKEMMARADIIEHLAVGDEILYLDPVRCAHILAITPVWKLLPVPWSITIQL